MQTASADSATLFSLAIMTRSPGLMPEQHQFLRDQIDGVGKRP